MQISALLQVIELLYGKLDNTEAIMVGGYVNHPLSVGSVRLRSNKPSDPPLIDTHYLEHPDDMNTMLEGDGGFLTCHQLCPHCKS